VIPSYWPITIERLPDESFPGMSPEEQKLDMDQRFSIQRGGVLRHYLRAYQSLPDASRDSEEVEKGIREFIENKGLFSPTEEEREKYNNPSFTEGALETVIRDWKRSTIRETMSSLRLFGYLDSPEKK